MEEQFNQEWRKLFILSILPFEDPNFFYPGKI